MRTCVFYVWILGFWRMVWVLLGFLSPLFILFHYMKYIYLLQTHTDTSDTYTYNHTHITHIDAQISLLIALFPFFYSFKKPYYLITLGQF